MHCKVFKFGDLISIILINLTLLLAEGLDVYCSITGKVEALFPTGDIIEKNRRLSLHRLHCLALKKSQVPFKFERATVKSSIQTLFKLLF